MRVWFDRLSLNVAQLEAYLDPPPKALWADDEAKRRTVTCATLLTEDSDRCAAREGEVVILRRLADRGPSVVDALASLPVRQLSAILVPAADASQEDRKQLSAASREHHFAAAVLDDATDLQRLANTLNRNLLPAQMDIAYLRVRGANTLQEAADTLARLIGDSVTIETPQDQLLAFSALKQQVDRIREETILFRRGNPDVRRWMDKEGYTKRLFESDDPLRIPPFKELNFPGRIAMRVALEGEVLGVIWFANADRALEGADLEIARETADVVATILMRERTVVQRDAELRAAIVDDIIRGRITNPENIHSLARSLGWNLDRTQQALAVVVDDVGSFRRQQATQSGRRLIPVRERLTELVRLESLAVDPDALVASLREGALVVFHAAGDDSRARRDSAVALARNIAKRVVGHDIGTTVTTGVGREFPSIDGLGESYRQAMTAASVGSTRLGGSTTLHFDELGIHRILHVLHQHDDQVPDALAALIEYDSRKNTELVKTLRVYFETMGRPSAAAQILHLHRNSFDYRIRRIQEIVGTTLDDPDTRLALELGIRLLEINGDAIPNAR
jgi:sugar diacid utilization regulator